jgi:hypothetical protein
MARQRQSQTAHQCKEEEVAELLGDLHLQFRSPSERNVARSILSPAWAEISLRSVARSSGS